MELFLMCIAVAYTLTGKFTRDTNQAAYKAGKEPPGLVKARMRHESGGGVRKPSGKPTGKGATRLYTQQRWANACEKAKDRADDKHRRWRAWYAEQAETRDEQWRVKQANRIAKSEQRAERFARARGLMSPAAWREDKAQRQAWAENDRRDQDTQPDTEQPVAEPRDEAQQPDEQPQQATPTQDTPRPAQTDTGTPEPAAAVSLPIPEQNTGSTEQTGATTVYDAAAARLHAAAEQIEQYRADLSAMADGLAGKGWGTEVHGPISDMDQHLADVAANYRDLAGQMQQQGDSVNDAHDEHPYVPGGDAVLA